MTAARSLTMTIRKAAKPPVRVAAESWSASKAGGEDAGKTPKSRVKKFESRQPEESASVPEIALFDAGIVVFAAALKSASEASSELLRMFSQSKHQPLRRPDHLSSAKYVKSGRLRLRFADGREFSLPVARLEMPVDAINWQSAHISTDGTALIVRHASEGNIPIDAAAVRCMVDDAYAANANLALTVLQMTRETREPLWRECPSLRVEGGIVRVGRTRVSLDVVVEEYESGQTPESIVRTYDSLTLADVRAVIAFYLNNREAVRAYMARREEEAEVLRARIEAERPRVTHQEPLARRTAKGKGHAAAGQ